jgi:hypothetical protein
METKATSPTSMAKALSPTVILLFAADNGVSLQSTDIVIYKYYQKQYASHYELVFWENSHSIIISVSKVCIRQTPIV